MAHVGRINVGATLHEHTLSKHTAVEDQGSVSFVKYAVWCAASHSTFLTSRLYSLSCIQLEHLSLMVDVIVPLR